MAEKSKSVLDGVVARCASCGKEVDNHPKPFPCGLPMPRVPPQGGSGTAEAADPRLARDLTLTVVGNCPVCGAPVYGQKVVLAGEEPQPVKYSCACRNPKLPKSNDFRDMVETK